ncbi:MAG: hypothetical protein LBG44_06430 [Gemmatimonadota bacterium]|jgi:hypothetical protein|nr:hypothetical protein [Gemmatimonadota bacterium]
MTTSSLMFEVTLVGTGSVEIAAFGIADAEASVEKEIRALLPGAAIRVHEVRRALPAPRIVETFEVSYSLRHRLSLEEPSEEVARRTAFRMGRVALEGSRFGRTVWESADVSRR